MANAKICDCCEKTVRTSRYVRWLTVAQPGGVGINLVIDSGMGSPKIEGDFCSPRCLATRAAEVADWVDDRNGVVRAN